MTTTGLLLPLAHAGEGATWQALLTLLALGLVLVVVLVAFRVVTVDEPGDLILPLAGTAVLASLSGATSTVLSDWVGWAFPIGVVALVALLLVALTSLELSPTSPVLWGAVVVATVAGVALQGPITRAWHPRDVLEALPVDDLAVEIVAPEQGATVPAGTIELRVAVTGGTLGQEPVETEAAPEDPEEQVVVLLSTLDESGAQVPSTFLGAPLDDCTSGCREASYEVTIDEPGTWTIYVEALSADRQRFTTTPTDRVTVTVTE